MKILFGGNFKVGQTGEFLYLALKRMGVDIVPFSASKEAPDDWIHVAADVDAVELLKSEAPDADLFLMVESSTGEPFLPRNIPYLEIPTAYWLYDNYLNFRWNKEAATLFDYTFFAQLYRTRQAIAYGKNNVHWLPFAADEIFHRNFNVKRDIDIGYVGSITGQKKKYFAEIEKAGLTVTTNDRYLSYEEIGQFYSRCKLVYNILARRDMNVRTFEAPYAGALLINQRWIDEGCHEIFTDGENMAFHNFTDAPQIIKKYLDEEKLRQKMAKNGEEIVAAGHTYRHRAEKIIDICNGGVTDERVELRTTFVMPLAESLVCGHRDFKWSNRAADYGEEATARSPFGVWGYYIKYAWWRIKEKIEKVIWSTGKAPV